MRRRTYVAMIILVLVITAIVQTFSTVENEHQFYATTQDKCTKCHADVKAQLITSAQHSSFSCIDCHMKSGINHTNMRAECNNCHTVGLGDTLEAHSGFASLNTDGCVSCHTNYNVVVNYSRAEYIDYDITNDNGNWVIGNFATIGTIDLSYNALKIGGDHNWKSSVSCLECHKDVSDAVSIGGHAIVLDKNGTQVLAHSTTNFPDLNGWCIYCHNRNDVKFPTQQHSARMTTCDECHEAYGLTHPGGLYTNIKTVPRQYRGLVCISCKSNGWYTDVMSQTNGNGTLHFTVREEPYYDVAIR